MAWRWRGGWDFSIEEAQANWDRECSLGARTFHILEANPMFRQDEKVSDYVNGLSVFMILVSVTAFCVDTMPDIYTENAYDRLGSPIFIIDTVCVGYFTVEVMIRLCFRTPGLDFWNFFTGVDVLSIGGFYIETIFALTQVNADSDSAGVLYIVRLLRISRTLRILKVSRYSKGLQLVGHVLQQSSEGLLLLCFLISLGVVISATMIYFVEVQVNPDTDYSSDEKLWINSDGTTNDFQSIPDAFWWAIVTICSVGFGDKVPNTPAGKTVAVLTMLFALLCISLPTILIGATFTKVHQEYKIVRAQKKLLMIFNKVRTILRFVRVLRQIRAKKGISDSVNALGSRAGSYIRPVNFQCIPTINVPDDEIFSDANESGMFDAIGTDFECEIDDIKYWTLNGSATALSYLQRLLICYSGVTSMKLLASDGNVKPILHLAGAGLVQLWLVDLRDPINTTGLVSLTKEGVDRLKNERESHSLKCTQTIVEAQTLWKNLTGEELDVSIYSEIRKTYKLWYDHQHSLSAAKESHSNENGSASNELDELIDDSGQEDGDDEFITSVSNLLLETMVKAVAKLQEQVEANERRIAQAKLQLTLGNDGMTSFN